MVRGGKETRGDDRPPPLGASLNMDGSVSSLLWEARKVPYTSSGREVGSARKVVE